MRRNAARRRGILGGAEAISQWVSWRDFSKAEEVADGFGDTTLRKTSTDNTWDGGAVGTARLDSGDGWVEMTVKETASDPVDHRSSQALLMMGLTNDNPDYNYTSIDFALFMNQGVNWRPYENGTAKGSYVALADGDVLRVEVVSGVVYYKQNGTTKYTSLVSPTYPLYVDASLEGYNVTSYLRAAVYKPRISAEDGDDWSIW